MNAVVDKPGAADVWRWLDDVPDPEIPVLSVNDLGIVRAVDVEQDGVVVTVTPTYSGCPATSAIALSIEEALHRRGVSAVRVRSRVSPPWTTDWISPAGREKLRAYGIAPPEGAACAGAAVRNAPKECPRCGSAKVEEVSRFGSTPCKAAYRCADCLEPFDYFKRF
ncbi:MAG: 1,2-phenylacetyl-CoA epoxidase subunit PaaD [Parvularculaceae bacterium]|nr:1,2-phenylacetyl-CoA epoxidase subunit PaaD [Parvularculaceae bacterium]